jgi:purine-nucleoside phosphorylase
MPKLDEVVRRIRSRTRLEPRVALVFGAGMEALADRLDVDVDVPAVELLGRSAGDDVQSRLLVGRLGGAPVVVLCGALAHQHLAHQHPLSLEQATLPVRAMRLLGGSDRPPALLLTGTCSALDPALGPGDLVLLHDHVNVTGENPLVGPNLDALGPRFPDMSEPYDRALQQAAVDAASARRIPLRRGVYVAVAGNQPPIPAEQEKLRWLGGDVVGSGVVQEVIVARHMGMRVLALLAVTHADPAGTGTGVRDEMARAQGGVALVLSDLCERLDAGAL